MIMRVCVAISVCVAFGCATAEKPNSASTLGTKPATTETTPIGLGPKEKVPGFAITHNIKKDGSPNGETFVQDKEWRLAEYIGSGGVRVEGRIGWLGSLAPVRGAARVELYEQRFSDFPALLGRRAVLLSFGLSAEY